MLLRFSPSNHYGDLMAQIIDIKAKNEGLAGKLSNFTARTFVFDGVLCNSIESILQSLKVADSKEQKRICSMQGKEAQAYGQSHNNWKDTQTLYWNGQSFNRNSDEYLNLVRSIFTAVYYANTSFRNELLATGSKELDHSIGKDDPTDTILTKQEFLDILYGLRAQLSA